MASEILDRDPILEMFLFESVQLIEQLEEQLLDIERSQHLTAIHVDAIFRIMHTIKGSSAMMEFDALAQLAHALEDLFEHYRSQPDTGVDCGRLADLVLKAVDFCKREIAKIERGESPDGQPEDLITQIRAFFAASMATHSQAETWIQPERYQARLWFEPGCAMENLRAFSAIHSLMPLTEEMTYVPADIADNEDSTSLIREQGFYIRFTSAAEPAILQTTLEQTLFLERLEFETMPQHEPVRDESGEIPALSPDQGEKSATGSSLISVPVRKLDQLMDLVGELVISEAMVIKNPELEGLELPSFQKAARQLFKLTNELQDLAMSIRMVPVAATFQKMQRIVRDMNRKLGKDVDLQLSGEETEVDKSIIDNLADPLMHLIRNALDHGIESPDERAAAGKPA
ncbi:MAG: Hpt domain-containing protein, partial [Eubacteriales bacterium]|nr:Hpt domain-containing protein [Eubacteriales bacterium]